MAVDSTSLFTVISVTLCQNCGSFIPNTDKLKHGDMSQLSQLIGVQWI